MDWEVGAQIAQVAATVLLAIGVGISINMSRRTFGEMRTERALRVRPRLLFRPGGNVVPCELSEGVGIPGVNIGVARYHLRDMPCGAKRCVPKSMWGRLVNHGVGAAIRARATFEIRHVTRAGERFALTESQLKEFPYSEPFNSIPVSPGNINAGAWGELFRFPTPVVVDWSGHISELLGDVRIECEDTFGNLHRTWQGFRVWVERSDSCAEMIVTFSDEVRKDERPSGGKKLTWPLRRKKRGLPEGEERRAEHAEEGGAPRGLRTFSWWVRDAVEGRPRVG